MNDQEMFLAALAKDEDDADTRMAYADWLEERGEVEEADRQRKWPAAKAWILEFHRTEGYHRNRYDDEEDDERYTSFDELMERARIAAVVDKDYSFSLGRDEGLCDGLRQHKVKFWECWSTVTGISVDAEKAEDGWFSCGC